MPVKLRNVYHVPQQRVNLLSVSQIVDNGNTDANGEVLASATLENNLFRLDLDSSYLIFLAAPNTCILWRSRMGHVGLSSMEKLKTLVHGIDSNLKVASDFVRKSCALAKSRRLPFDKSSSGSTRILDLVHSDIAGPYPSSLSGSKYVITFLDDFSHKMFIYFLKSKVQAYSCLVDYKK
ncbi:hypothetical protein JTB14_012172 [Gonioctena quinquepunctata]|nr:hypothetical protein JTB14_012172 [Gonioctena quinquepunctata]